MLKYGQDQRESKYVLTFDMLSAYSLLYVNKLSLVFFMYMGMKQFLADRTNGRAYATVLRPSVCDVMYCG